MASLRIPLISTTHSSRSRPVIPPDSKSNFSYKIKMNIALGFRIHRMQASRIWENNSKYFEREAMAQLRKLRLVDQRRIRRKYTDEELTLFWNLSKIEIIQLMSDEAHARRSGDQFTLPELLEGIWKHLRPG